MGGDDSDLQGLKSSDERHFFRGKALVDVNPGDRVYFVEKGSVTGYAKYQTYEPRWGVNMTEEGWLDAFVITGPYVPIDPPEPMIDGYKGRWPARYVHTVPGLAERLGRRTA